MLNPDRAQWKVIWWTLGIVFVFWLIGQGSDSSYTERFWNRLAMFMAVVGALRVWMLEGRKSKQSE